MGLEGFIGAQAISDIKYEALCRSMVLCDAMRLHAMDDRADEINVKNRKDVHEVEDGGEDQETASS